MLNPFSIARLPRIEFGSGVFLKVAGIATEYGRHILLVTGARSFQNTRHWKQLQTALKQQSIRWKHCSVADEPSPSLVDEAVAKYIDEPFDAVIGIGGGSALDAAKAIAGLLRVRRSVMDYLEGVGPQLSYEGPCVPFIAIPTTAGTGSEATKNAVLSIRGEQGFKKSFRHERLVAEYAIVDPELLSSCPAQIIAANGMDALTQVLEAYVSTGSNPFTDALGISALDAIREGLLPWFDQGPKALQAQQKMAYAALVSGINLAQTGLGSVHGLASPLGAFYPIPHGEVCGTLVATATQINIRAMLEREPDNPALIKYAQAAEILCERRFKTPETAWDALIELLNAWTEHLELSKLSHYGLQREDLDHVVAHSRGSSMKTNPIVLTDAEIFTILEKRL
jgi:alcohol dehydrogenase